MPKFRKALTLFDDYYDMMSDKIRLKAYAAAIAEAVRPGDTVVDLGAGLGILSFLAVRAGAAKVVAIEKGDAIELARSLATQNQFASRIEFIQENSKHVVLPEPAHVLVSETLGSFGVDENTLDFTLDARDRLLAPGGRMVPQRLELWLAPVELPKAHERLSFWQNVADFDFSPAIDALLGRMHLADIAPRDLLAPGQVYRHIDLTTETQRELAERLLFPIARAGTLHGLGGWFTAQLTEAIAIRTAPQDPKTHWQQAFFPFRAPVAVVAGDYLEVTLRIGPKGPESDDTLVSYDYRCTQLASERSAATPSSTAPTARNTPCPCGSGKKFKRCCGS